MRERSTTWGEVEFGTIVKAKDGTVWEVTDRGLSERRLGADGHLNQFRTGKTAPPPKVQHDTPVVVLEPDMDEAVAEVAQTLGGQVVSDAAGPATAPDDARTARINHLAKMHGAVVDPWTVTDEALLDTHSRDHAHPNPHMVAHTHGGSA